MNTINCSHVPRKNFFFQKFTDQIQVSANRLWNFRTLEIRQSIKKHTLTLQASSLLAKHIVSKGGGGLVRWIPPQDFRSTPLRLLWLTQRIKPYLFEPHSISLNTKRNHTKPHTTQIHTFGRGGRVIFLNPELIHLDSHPNTREGQVSSFSKAGLIYLDPNPNLRGTGGRGW